MDVLLGWIIIISVFLIILYIVDFLTKEEKPPTPPKKLERIIETKPAKIDFQPIKLKVQPNKPDVFPTEYPFIIKSNSAPQIHPFNIPVNGLTYKGVCEKTFELQLKDKIDSSSLFSNRVVEIDSNKFECDFIYFHNDQAFNIEIDEPYTYNNSGEGIPIHYVRSKDELRDKLFVKNGIHVIRIAEIQIVQHQNEIVNYVQALLHGTKAKFHEMTNKWTIEESNQMITDKFREEYLNKEFTFSQLRRFNYFFLILDIQEIVPYLDRNKEHKVKITYSNSKENISIISLNSFESIISQSKLPDRILTLIKVCIVTDKYDKVKSMNIITIINALLNKIEGKDSVQFRLKSYGTLNKPFWNLEIKTSSIDIC